MSRSIVYLFFLSTASTPEINVALTRSTSCPPSVVSSPATTKGCLVEGGMETNVLSLSSDDEVYTARKVVAAPPSFTPKGKQPRVMKKDFSSASETDDSESNYVMSANSAPSKPIAVNKNSKIKVVANVDWLVPLLQTNEEIVATALVGKPNPMSILKKRQLILTDAPRLFYVDPKTLVVKGTIEWTRDCPPFVCPVSCFTDTIAAYDAPDAHMCVCYILEGNCT